MLEHIQANAVVICLESKCGTHVCFSRLVVQVPHGESLNIVNLLEHVRIDFTFTSCSVHRITYNCSVDELKHVGFNGLREAETAISILYFWHQLDCSP